MSPPATTKTFSEHCVDAMNERIKIDNQRKEIGSKLVEAVGNPDGLRVTDCITFVFDVLMYGYSQLGVQGGQIVKQLKALPRDGINLSNFLLKHGWKAHYWNPDVHNPKDMGQWDTKSEHRFSFQRAHETMNYSGLGKGNAPYHVPLSGMIVGYNKTKVFNDGRPVQKLTTVDPVNKVTFDRLNKVRFCVGICRGGMHTFLMSDGKVWEVHWAARGDSGNLYEISDFVDYEWLSGIVVTPPDSNFASRHICEIRAGVLGAKTTVERECKIR
jgi:hypothetical protein